MQRYSFYHEHDDTFPSPNGEYVLYTDAQLLEKRVKELEAALAKIDAIRNSIVGLQSINWSAHIYPLVAALEEAGYHGMGYEEAKRMWEMLIEPMNKLIAEYHARAGGSP